MNIEFINVPYRVSLIGYRGLVVNQNYGPRGMELMNSMWSELRKLGLATTGINHWVYLSRDSLFTGVELDSPSGDVGSLERIEVVLDRYAKFVHRGPYTKLPSVWGELMVQLAAMGEATIFPNLEVYGHWNEDPEKLETTILIGLRDPLHTGC